jgi:hypothetical protein
VTNGLVRDVTSQDYIAFLADLRQTMAREAAAGRAAWTSCASYKALPRRDRQLRLPQPGRPRRASRSPTRPGLGAGHAELLERRRVRRPGWRRRARPRGQQRRRGGVRLSQRRAHRAPAARALQFGSRAPGRTASRWARASRCTPAARCTTTSSIRRAASSRASTTC